MTQKSFTLHPIGRVACAEGDFRVELAPEFKAGLVALDGFSHVQVIWWAHKSDTPEGRAVVQCRKPYRKGPDVIGVFATRAEYRPNPVALSVVPVISVDAEAGIIRVPWIDALDGSPVLDIKPYQPSVDRVRKVAVPEWGADWPKYMEDSADFDWSTVFNFPH